MIPDDGSVTRIGDEAFLSLGLCSAVTVPSGVTAIGEMAFASNTELPAITLPASLTYVGGYAFHDCWDLQTVYYEGSPARRDRIVVVDEANSYLTNANWI